MSSPDDLEFSVDKLSTVDCLETDKSQDSSVFLKKLCKQAMDAISLVYVLCRRIELCRHAQLN